MHLELRSFSHRSGGMPLVLVAVRSCRGICGQCEEGGVENTLYLLVVVVLGRLDVLWMWGKVSKKHERANNKLFVCG
jgi:hypothetical protein